MPVPLRRYLGSHVIDTTYERGWSTWANGSLMDAAAADGYDVLVTTDQNIKHQQDLSRRRFAVIILLSTAWPRIRQKVPEIVAAVSDAKPGTVTEAPV